MQYGTILLKFNALISPLVRFLLVVNTYMFFLYFNGLVFYPLIYLYIGVYFLIFLDKFKV